MVGGGQQPNNRLGFDTQYSSIPHEIADDARQEDAIMEKLQANSWAGENCNARIIAWGSCQPHLPTLEGNLIWLRSLLAVLCHHLHSKGYKHRRWELRNPLLKITMKTPKWWRRRAGSPSAWKPEWTPKGPWLQILLIYLSCAGKTFVP